MALVIDASVLVAWFVPSQATDYARRVARRVRVEDVVVPAILEIEFANTMLVLKRRRMLPPHAVESALSRAARLDFKVDREPVAPRELYALGERHGISAYDAAYLELALRCALPLATRDTSLARAARSAGVLLN